MVDFDPQGGRLAAIESRLDRIEPEVRAIRDDVKTLKGSASALKWILGLGLLAALALTWFAGQSVIAEIARRVVREELAYRGTTVQQGRFSAATRVSADGYDFAWALKVPVDPEKVTMLAAETLSPLPGIAVSAKLNADGTKCIMTLHGDDTTLAALPEVIDAKVTIATRQ